MNPGVLDIYIWDLRRPTCLWGGKKTHIPSLMLKPLKAVVQHNTFYRQPLRPLSAAEIPLFLCCAPLYVALSAN